MTAVHFITVTALTLQMIGTYLVWPSRWNVPAHAALGFCVTAYVFPGLATDIWESFDARTNLMYAQINVLGALSMVAGLFVGFRLNLFVGFRPRLLRLFQGVMQGAPEGPVPRSDIYVGQLTLLAPLVAIMFAIGLYPYVLTNLMTSLGQAGLAR